MEPLREEMRVVTVGFDYEHHQDMYLRMLRVFELSVRRHEPGAEFVAHVVSAPPLAKDSFHRKTGTFNNTVKLGKWVEEMERSEAPVMFSDCDMLMVAPVSGVWKLDFDVAFTRRDSNDAYFPRWPNVTDYGRRSVGTWKNPGRRLPLNGGVVFARPNDRTRSFFRRWMDANNRMITDRPFHTKWKNKYAGINQASFGYMLENDVRDAKVVSLPCSVWNAVAIENWANPRADIRMAHLKRPFRQMCLGLSKANPRCKKLISIWQSYEKEGTSNVPHPLPALQQRVHAHAECPAHGEHCVYPPYPGASARSAPRSEGSPEEAS